MKVYFKELTLSTNNRFEVIDLTKEVEEAVRESGVKNGLCVIHAPHATVAIIANEAEPGLMKDYIDLIKELTRPDYEWRHNIIDNNAHAHLASAIIGSTRCIPVRNGRLERGTWQNIMLVELDGPRTMRRVIIEVLGEE